MKIYKANKVYSSDNHDDYVIAEVNNHLYRCVTVGYVPVNNNLKYFHLVKWEAYEVPEDFKTDKVNDIIDYVIMEGAEND